MSKFNNAYKFNKEQELPFFCFLSSLRTIGKNAYERMQEYFESPKNFYCSSEELKRKCGVFSEKMLEEIRVQSLRNPPEKLFEDLWKKRIKYVCCEDEDFPKRLTEIPDSPKGLFYKGKLPKEEAATVGVIGARECSFYGEEVATVIGETLGMYGIPVVSGMARGIDSLSQLGALEKGGLSYAVLGGGVDICYPRESRRLYEMLMEQGGILSEYAPGVNPEKLHFVRRNRIISGLSDVVCVVEAKKKSGTLITVDCALEQGREVVAVPGRITDRTSIGCNELIRQGAEIVNDPESFAKDVILKYGNTVDQLTKYNNEETVSFSDMSFLEKRIITIMESDSFTVEELISYRGMGEYSNSYEMLTACMNLSFEGYLSNQGAGRFSITPKGRILKNTLEETEEIDEK